MPPPSRREAQHAKAKSLPPRGRCRHKATVGAVPRNFGLYNRAQTCYNACIREERERCPIPCTESRAFGGSADRKQTAARPGVKPVFRRLAHVTRKSGPSSAGKQSGTAKHHVSSLRFCRGEAFFFSPQKLSILHQPDKEDTTHGIQALQPGRDRAEMAKVLG